MIIVSYFCRIGNESIDGFYFDDWWTPGGIQTRIRVYVMFKMYVMYVMYVMYDIYHVSFSYRQQQLTTNNNNDNKNNNNNNNNNNKHNNNIRFCRVPKPRKRHRLRKAQPGIH